MAYPSEVTSMALFCDFENIALGVRDANYEKFDIGKVLERLLLKGSIVVKKAYCDWDRYKAFKAPMHEASFELIEIPHVRQSGKNSADIRLVVDALDLCYTKSHVETFVIISGDSDFSPLVSKLRENAKVVIGVGVKNSTSDLLIANCDEFIFYDDLVREKRNTVARRTAATNAGAAKTAGGSRSGASKTTSAASQPTATETMPARAARTVDEAVPVAAKAAATKPADGARSRRRSTKSSSSEPAAEVEADIQVADIPAEPLVPAAESAVENRPGKTDDERRDEAIDLIVETVEALISERGEEDKIWGSMVKQALKRRKPSFNESYYGFRSFKGLLEEAARLGALVLEREEKSQNYRVRLPAHEE
jgi:uncharacterized LabA/DUF88 family protein